ncbi:uncharacterized protein LOC143293893 [Babylonia areolata]|uniref:uncharacterized protein LOC143293893 n=1 Tax=Babylonia areolata TaxID=304850 RepID=UPI003FD45FFA
MLIICFSSSVQVSGSDVLALKNVPKEHYAYVAHTFLVGLRKEKDLVSLAKVASRHEFQFRLEALHFICWLLLETPSSFSCQTLRDAEKDLFRCLEQCLKEQEGFDQKKHYVEKCLDFTEFLAVVYLMVVYRCVLSLDKGQGNAFCPKILQRPFFQSNKKSIFRKLSELTHVGVAKSSVTVLQETLQECLTAWSKYTNVDQVGKTLRRLVGRTSEWAKVTQWPTCMKFPLLVECLTLSFQKSEPVFVDFLKSFRPRKVKVKETSVTLQRMITSLSIVGITAFLKQNMDKLSSSENFKTLYSQTVDYLDIVVSNQDPSSQSRCIFFMTPLLFSMNKTIRQRTGSLLRQQLHYQEHMWEFLLLETVLIFWPTLSVKDAKLDSKTRNHQSWIVLPSTFNESAVQTHIHRPTGPEHWKHNRSTDKGILQSDQYQRELSLLKELRHENIVSLVAVHDLCCPQVYITEDYLTDTLQSNLVNRSKNGHHYPVHRLLNILLEILKGVQFCHEKNIVHRGLTAGNAFFTAEQKVKLAGFKHALKLPDKPEVMDYDLSFIATRWSAPESHKSCCFSKATDMWMVGHMVYEILTHGRQPYADFDKPDEEELMKMVVIGKKRLCNERCIPQTLQDMIMKLTNIREVERGSIQEVVTAVQKALRSPKELKDLELYFPDLGFEGQAATELTKGPIVALIEDFPQMDMSPGAKRKTMKKPGSMHFEEPCPDSFQLEEWNILRQEDLPSITKLIGRPRKNKHGRRILPFVVATPSTLMSLQQAMRYRLFGKDLRPYVLCMQELAKSIAHLHSRRIILCDFSPDTIYVEKQSTYTTMKVWITSLPKVKMLPEGSELERHIDLLHPPKDPEERARAAPEVKQHAQYSPASDVYCFSILLLWLLKSLCPQSSEQQECDVYENEHLTIPSSCPPHLVKLLKDCWQLDKTRRPPMDIVRINLTLDRALILKAQDDDWAYELNVANPSDTDSFSDTSSTCSSRMSVEYGNLSEAGDIEEDETYFDLEDDMEEDYEEPAYDDCEKLAGAFPPPKTDTLKETSAKHGARPQTPLPPIPGSDRDSVEETDQSPDPIYFCSEEDYQSLPQRPGRSQARPRPPAPSPPGDKQGEGLEEDDAMQYSSLPPRRPGRPPSPAQAEELYEDVSEVVLSGATEEVYEDPETAPRPLPPPPSVPPHHADSSAETESQPSSEQPPSLPPRQPIPSLPPRPSTHRKDESSSEHLSADGIRSAQDALPPLPKEGDENSKSRSPFYPPVPPKPCIPKPSRPT